VLSFIIPVCFFASNLLAQQRPFGPTHPSFFYTPVRLGTNIDTVIEYTKEWVIGHENSRVDKTYYSRSEDKMTDSVYSVTPNPAVHRYNEKNQLLSNYTFRSSDLPGYLDGGNYVKNYYDYDDEGRVVRSALYLISSSENTSEELLAERIWDYSTIRRTDKGFIYDGIECETDNQGRITLIKYLAKVDTIVELEGEKYRVNDAFITYTDSTYTLFGCFYINSNTTPEGPISWQISTVAYNENGDEKWSTFSMSDDGKKWSPVRETKTEYLYSGNDDVSNLIVIIVISE